MIHIIPIETKSMWWRHDFPRVRDFQTGNGLETIVVIVVLEFTDICVFIIACINNTEPLLKRKHVALNVAFLALLYILLYYGTNNNWKLMKFFKMDAIPSTLFVISLVYAQICSAHVNALNTGLLNSEMISRTTRSIPMQCGVEFVFERFAGNKGMNRTQMNTLMKQLGIGNSITKKDPSNNCNKVSRLDFDALSLTIKQ